MKIATPRGRFEVRRAGAGDGTPILMLHPLALSGAVWDPVAAFFGQSRMVLAPDARGHGESEWDGRPFTVQDMAADAAEIVRSEAAAPVDVVGLSMGGSTAIVLAATDPEIVRRLILADTTAWYGDTRLADWAQRARNSTAKARSEQLSFQLDRWFSDGFRGQCPDEVKRVAGIFLRTDSAAHAAACRALGGLDARDLLAKITAPTLVLVGEQDYATPPEMAASVATGIGGSKLEVLTGARHLALIEQSAAWPRMLRFL